MIPGSNKNVSLLVVTVDGGNILPKKTKTNHKKKSYLTDEHTKIHRKDGPQRFKEHFAVCVFFCFFSTQNLFLGCEARQSLEKDMGFL